MQYSSSGSHCFLRFVRVFLLPVTIYSLAYHAYSQQDLTEVFKPNLLPVVSPYEYLDVEFTWNIPGKAQAYLNAGITELKEGSPPMALQNFNEAIQQHEFWVSYYYRGIIHRILGNNQEAENDFKQVLKLQKTCAEALYALGDLYQQTEKFDQAASYYESAIKLDPKLVRGTYQLGNLALLAGEINRAVKYYEKCIQIDPAFPDAYLRLGLLKFSPRKKDRDAIVYLDKAIQVDSTFENGLYWRGLIYILLNDFEEGLSDWNRLIQMNPNNPLLLSNRGVVYMALDDYENAYRDLRDALMMYYEDEEQFAGQQTLIDKRIDLQAAVSYLNRYGYGLPEKSFLQIKKGFCLLITGKPQESIKNFKAAAYPEPSAAAFYLTGLAYEQVPRFDSAHFFYDLALKYDEDLLDAYKKRAIYRYEMRDWKGSYNDFSQMIRLQPESLVPYRLRGFVKSNLRDFYGCILDLTHVLNSDSSDYEVWKTRGYCRQQVGDTLGALNDYRKGLKINTTDADLYEIVAQSFLKAKDTSSALEVLMEYENAFPNSDKPVLQKVRILIEQNKLEQARSELDKLITSNPTIHYDRQYLSYIQMLEGLIDMRSGKLKNAKEKFTASLKNNPELLEARLHRYKTYVLLGEAKKAEEDLLILKKSNYKDAGLPD
jgi:tetratricopeptide (TPR) repeat protein